MSVTVLILAAVVVEGLITYLKEALAEKRFQWQMLLSIAIGVSVAVLYQVDLFALVGAKSILSPPWLSQGVGCTLTGILISRGSNYVFDLIAALSQVKQRLARQCGRQTVRPVKTQQRLRPVKNEKGGRKTGRNRNNR